MTVSLVPARRGLEGWLLTTDHKRIGLLTIGTAVLLFFVFGALALTMRAELATPGIQLYSSQTYSELFTEHGSGMIYLVITPIALGLGVYLIPLQVGAPSIAAPRLAYLGFATYVAGAVLNLMSWLTLSGAASTGWYAYTPLSTVRYTPGHGMDMWIAGTFLAGLGQILLAGTSLWTALRMRTPQMTMFRMPLFTWSMVASDLMVIASFPALLAAMSILGAGRFDPSIFSNNTWDVAYQDVFWFYGHPVVYVMFFPFVGAVMEVLAVFGRRRFVGYKATAISLMTFATMSMGVWGHHMFTTGQISNDYYSLVSIFLLVPAGLEYFGMFSTILGAKLTYRTPLLFALAFIPQFLIGGLTGIMIGSPVLDYHFHGSYFIVAHFHYTLFAGSVFGMFAGIYYWFPKASGRMLSERLGKVHFVLMVVGTNVTFLPMFGLGFLGMSRRVETYPASFWFDTLNLISTIGSGILGIAMLVFAWNLIATIRHGERAPSDPWGGFTIEWATTSPPPPLNFPEPLPPIRSYAPLLDLREELEEAGGHTGAAATVLALHGTDAPPAEPLPSPEE